MPNLTCVDFSPGLNTLFDERAIMPNVPGEAAESPYMENVEITAKGAIITSTGFDFVSSIAGTGGTKNLMTYEKTPTTRFMIIAHADHYYSVNPSSFVWTDIGDYGTEANNIGGVVYKGTTSTRRAILGNNVTANTTQVWPGTGSIANLGGSPPDGWIMASFMGRLFIAQADSPTLFFTAIEDETNWAGGGFIGFDDIITGLGIQGEFMIVFTRREAYSVQFLYDNSFNLSIPLKKPFKAAAGCLGHKTIQPVYNDVFYFSPDGVQRFGNDAQFIAQNLRVNSLSWKINPSLTGDKFNPSKVDNSCGIYFEKKYFTAIPGGMDQFNSKLFVYNYDYDSWSFRTGIYPSNFAIMPNTSGKDELYFASHLAPELYKFNNTYDYNGADYNRKYKTKRFTFGNHMASKFFKWIDIRGSMFINTVFYVDVEVDGVVKTYKIDQNNIETVASGGYYGDDYYGNQYLGGPTVSQFKRFGARIPFTFDIKSGRELQITFRNQAAGQPWKIDYLDIVWDWEAPIKIPVNFQEVNLVT